MEYKGTTPLKKIEIISKETILESEKRRLQVYQDKVTCKPGCSYCCGRPVYATLGEICNISEALKKKGKLKEVVLRAEELIEMGEIPIMAWYELQLKCPILDPTTNRCLAYESRPIMCSTHYSVQDPEACNPHSFREIEYKTADMDNILEEANEKIKKASGKSFWGAQVILHYFIKNVHELKSRDGLQMEDILSLMARGF